MLVGAAADAEGLFARLAAPLAGRPPLAVLAGLLALDAVVTAILNLDTAAAFVTPLMLYAARASGADEAPFLYGSVLMANAASLFLPGSNLTNLLVVGHGTSGASFARELAPAALVAVAVTGAGLLGWAALRPARTATSQGARPPDRSRTATSQGARPPDRSRPGWGTAAAGIAAVLVVALPEPALPVLAVGLVAAALRLDRCAALEAVGPWSLLALLVLAVALGALAREVDLVLSTGRWATAGIAAGLSVAVNNLPAATLLSAQPPVHPAELLVGLNLGPNLAVTGSLSALIWWRTARRLGAQPSVLRYSAVGAPLAVVAIALCLISLPG